jgi:glycosyltransferase involved in cell wall biosynthesis
VAEAMVRAGCKARFVIVGDGPMQEMVARRCALNSSGLLFLGIRDDVPGILRASDVFVAPYRWQEAFGLTVAEASASGIPVVASDVGAISEIVADGVTGILVEPGNTTGMEAAIQQLLHDDQLRGEMGRAARCRVEELFSLSGAVRHTVDTYRRCLRRKRQVDVSRGSF